MVCKSICRRMKQPQRKKRVPVQTAISKPVCGACTCVGNPGVRRSSGMLQGKWWNPSEVLCCPLIFHKGLNKTKACTCTSGYLVTSPPSPASEPEEQDWSQEKSFTHLIYKVKTDLFFLSFANAKCVFVSLQKVI